MNTEPDLPEVDSFRKVSELPASSAVRAYSELEEGRQDKRQPAEAYFRKELQEAISGLKQREDTRHFNFGVVVLEGLLMVEVRDNGNELVVLLTAEALIKKAKNSEMQAFFVDQQC